MPSGCIENNTEIPKIGDIWLVTYPEIYYDENSILNVRTQTRPFLILDDGRGLLVENDEANFHGFKLTSQRKQDPRRKPIRNWKSKGLLRKSYVRIEMPLKIEYPQFRRKIAELESEELKEMYQALYSILNVDALKKIAESEEAEVC